MRDGNFSRLLVEWLKIKEAQQEVGIK